LVRSLEYSQIGTIGVLRRITIVGLILPFLLFAAAAWNDYKIISAGVAQDGAKTVALFREQVGNLFSGHQLLLDMTVDRIRGLDWETIQSSKDILNEIEVVDRLLDGVSEILLVDATGRVRTTTIHVQANEPAPVADQNCFKMLSRGELGSCISRPHTNSESGHFLFSLSRRLEKDGVFNGIAQVAVSADYLVELWAAARPSISDIVTLFSTDGTVLAQTQPMSQPLLRLPDIGETLVNRIGQRETGVVKAPLFPDNADWITVFSKTANQPVYIALSRDNSVIMSAWYANLTIYGLVAASAAAGIVAALGIALRRAQNERRTISLWRAEIEEREKAQEQLRQSQKLEGLGKLTGGIAHDFNNLLTVIIGNITLAQIVAPNTKSEKFLRNALRASETAVSLTRRLLAFARKQVLKPKSVDLPGLVEGMHDLLLRTLGPEVRLTVPASVLLWPALIDPGQIEMVILNLAVNARDAMPNGGTFSIITLNGEVGADSPHELAPGQYVIITVSDTGTGMDEATLARAMEPFFSTKEMGRGTGLGLSMMQGVVAQSGGAVRIHSVLGRGTEIEMWLPRAHTPPAEPIVPKMRKDPPGNGLILVCDDDPAVLEFVCEALKTKGYQVLSATNGASAVDILNGNEQIRLLVVDYTMPGMNGAAVTRNVRASHPKLPILLMTGNADPGAIRAGLPDVNMLLKPFDRDELTNRISVLLKPEPKQQCLMHVAEGQTADA
jgi:signal transduction histidine kinase/ActR/RegA family two-component response regulator